MSFLTQMKAFIAEHQLCQSGDRILLGLSGGKDSVLLLHLLLEAGYEVGIAHAHFGLRPVDADLDLELARKYADQYDLPFYSHHFATETIAQQEGISIQMAARELRYDWFEQLRVQHAYAYIATAHHNNDHLETFLLHLMRGKGLHGLRGILPKRQQIIRPLLFASVDAIQNEISLRNLEYRDDLSNFSSKYARNKVRLEIFPLMQTIYPQASHNMRRSIAMIQSSIALTEDYVRQWKAKEWNSNAWGGFSISIDAFLNLAYPEICDYMLFESYGFSAEVLSDLRIAVQRRHVGSLFESATHVINVDRQHILIFTKNDLMPPVSVDLFAPQGTIKWGNGQMKWEHLKGVPTIFDVKSIYLDASLIKGSTYLRRWEEEDRMRPFGMKGKTKKISDIWVELKIPHYMKSQLPLLVDSEGEIIANLAYRGSDTYKVSSNTKELIKITYFYNDER
jgi:tRNA(Ile)-lysidine synthase